MFDINLSDLRFRQTTLPQGSDIYDLFLKAQQRFEKVCYLESLGEYSDFSRYSALYFAPRHHARCEQGVLLVDDQRVEADNPFDALQAAMRSLQLDVPAYCGGLYGYFSYEGTRYLDDVPGMKANEEFADFEFGLYLDGLLYDKQTGELSYFTLDDDRQGLVEDLLNAPAAVLQPLEFKELEPNISEDEYNRLFDRAKEHIAWGDVFQLILSVRFPFELKGDPAFVYDRLREINPSPYLSYLRFGERIIVTSSVDLVTRVKRQADGSRRIENFALAGTTIRGKTPDEDTRLFEEIKQDPKERAEHMMLVDLSRNDVGRVAAFGSVQVEEFMVPKRFSHVQHIESKITGTVRDDKDAFDCFRATAPMGTVTGAPKIEAMKILNHLEPTPRGPYSGCLGGFGLGGECIFSVGVRSLFVSGKSAYTQVGSGLVYDSTPDYEYRELRRKRRGIMAAMGGVVGDD